MPGDEEEGIWASGEEDALIRWTSLDFDQSPSHHESNNHSNETLYLSNWTLYGNNSTGAEGNWWDKLGPPCQLKLTTQHIVLIVCFTIIFTLSVIGNCLVIVTIAQNRWMRTVTNIFLQSLAISDLLLSVICMPPTLTAMLFQCFLWGQAMCKLIMYLQRKFPGLQNHSCTGIEVFLTTHVWKTSIGFRLEADEGHRYRDQLESQGALGCSRLRGALFSDKYPDSIALSMLFSLTTSYSLQRYQWQPAHIPSWPSPWKDTTQFVVHSIRDIGKRNRTRSR